MNRIMRNVLIGTLVGVGAVCLVLLLVVGLAQGIQSWILDTYGGSVAVAELYLVLGELLACGVGALLAVIIARDNRLRVFGIAMLAMGLTILTWIGVNYAIVAAFNATSLSSVNMTDFFLVQAYAAAYAFPAVTYYWVAVAGTYAVWFTILLVSFGGVEPRLKYRLKAVHKPKPKRRQR